MKKIVKILFGSAVLSYALSTVAMEKEIIRTESSENTKKVEMQQPLKFKFNRETGDIEDVEGSHFILEYRSAVRDLCEGYGSLRDSAQNELDELKVALGKMSKDSDDYFATEIYKNKLVSRVCKFQKKVSDIIDQEIFLGKLLKEIYSNTNSTYDGYFALASLIPDYGFLSQSKFKEIEKLDFRSYSNQSGTITVGKHLFNLEIRCQFSSTTEYELREEFRQILGCYSEICKLTKTQNEIFEKSKIIYRLSTNTVSKLDSKEQFLLKIAQDIAQTKQKAAISVLKEQIDNLIYKAENIYIPQIAPKYMFAKTLIAFCEEVVRHKAIK